MSRTTENIIRSAENSGKPVKRWLSEQTEQQRRDDEERRFWEQIESREYWNATEDDEIQEVS